ncbi:MAG: phosphoglycerate dehydrogenase, partial [Rhodospirillaceae bacterium]|nr:phosphoglycerate dehydrogenase [Rhodospirillaceae bacterium]
YSDNGSTVGAVNVPEVSLPVKEEGMRFMHIHANVPGVMRHLNDVFSSRNLNIISQYLQTDPELGYVVVDIQGVLDETDIMDALHDVDGTIRTRFLY